MALSKNQNGKVTVENATVATLKDGTNLLCLIEALNDIQRSLQRKDYDMVLLSMGTKRNRPQISYKDRDGDWNFVPGGSLVMALVEYGKLLTDAQKLE